MEGFADVEDGFDVVEVDASEVAFGVRDGSADQAAGQGSGDGGQGGELEFYGRGEAGELSHWFSSPEFFFFVGQVG
jgi:hypothetical protein